MSDADARRSSRISWLAASVVLLVALAFLWRQADRATLYTWDLIPYLGCVAELHHDDPADVHAWTRAAVEERLPADRLQYFEPAPRFETHPEYGFRRAVWTEPDALVSQLHWYRPRVGFTWLLAATHAVVPQPFDALRALVSASYAALVVLLFAWSGRTAGPWTGLAVALAVGATRPLTHAARFLTADLTATALGLAALWALFGGRRAGPAFALATASVLVRPDQALTFACVFALAALGRRLVPESRRWVVAVGAAWLPLLAAGLNAWAGHPGWRALVVHTFFGASLTPRGDELTVDRYLELFVRLGAGLDDTSTLLFLALAILVVALTVGSSSEISRKVRLVTLGLLAGYAARFLLFPVLWDRFWLLFDLWIVVAFVLLLADPRAQSAADAAR